MAESISLEVGGKVPKGFLRKLCVEITPEYVRQLLTMYGLPTDNETVKTLTTSYASGFPTQDLALRILPTEEGMKFWGIASGYSRRFERVAVKYLILEHFQRALTARGIPSELNIADLNPETITYMEAHKIFGKELPRLREVAKKRGNLENVALGLCGALQTYI